MTLLTSFVFVPQPFVLEVIPPDSVTLGVPINPVLGEISAPSGITTGSMGTANIPAGIPSIFSRTFSISAEEKYPLFENLQFKGSTASLEPSKTILAKLNKVQPITTEVVNLDV